MNQFSQLLSSAAQEARTFSPNQGALDLHSKAWFEQIAVHLEQAASLKEATAIEREIHTIAHIVLDSGPSDSKFIPSFFKALDASQRLGKRR